MNNVNKLELSVFPNPTTGIFTLQINHYEQGSLFISNALGQTIQQQSITSSRVELNLSEQASGVYFIRIKTAEGEAIQKLILQK